MWRREDLSAGGVTVQTKAVQRLTQACIRKHTILCFGLWEHSNSTVGSVHVVDRSRSWCQICSLSSFLLLPRDLWPNTNKMWYQTSKCYNTESDITSTSAFRLKVCEEWTFLPTVMWKLAERLINTDTWGSTQPTWSQHILHVAQKLHIMKLISLICISNCGALLLITATALIILLIPIR